MRSFNKIPTGFWDAGDEAWCKLSFRAMGRYAFLRTQDDITRAGTIRMRLRPWSRFGSDVTPQDVETELDELWQAGFILVDWDTEEILVRGYILSDEVFKHANSLRSAKASALALESVAIKAALLEEVRRLPGPPHMSQECLDIARDIMVEIEPLVSPSHAAPVPFSRGKMGAAATLAGFYREAPAAAENVRVNTGESGKSSPSGASKSQVPTGSSEGVVTSNLKLENKNPAEPDGSAPPDDDDPGPGAGSAGAEVHHLRPAAADPDPGDLPAGTYHDDGTGRDYPRTAQGLVGLWIDHCDPAPLDRVKGHVAREIKNLLDELVPWDDVRAGLAQWHLKRQNPGTIPSFVHAARQGPAVQVRAGRPQVAPMLSKEAMMG